MKKTMIPELSEFDPTKYLDDDEAAVHYVRLAIEDGDPWLLAAALGDVARARGMKQVALDEFDSWVDQVQQDPNTPMAECHK